MNQKVLTRDAPPSLAEAPNEMRSEGEIGGFQVNVW